MNLADLDKTSKLSPFGLKDTLSKFASGCSEQLMVDAGSR
jgi:hypothetical protein